MIGVMRALAMFVVIGAVTAVPARAAGTYSPAVSGCTPTIVPTTAPGTTKPNAAAEIVLSSGSVYIAPAVIAGGHASPRDILRLQRLAALAACRSVTVKIALLSGYPAHFPSEQDAAAGLDNNLNFSGVLVLVTPQGLALGSDLLSSSDIARITHKARPDCGINYSRCAVAAVRAALPRVAATQRAATRNVEVFWAVAVVIFGVIVAGLVLAARRRQQGIIAAWHAEEQGSA